MSHSSEMLWSDAQDRVANIASQTLEALLNSEKIYLDLFEVYQFTGATDQLMADQLFSDLIVDEARAPAVASVEEVAKVADLRSAIVALHELYGALTNVVTPTEDRAALLRRMS